MLKEEKELRDLYRRLSMPMSQKESWDPNYLKKSSRLITALVRAVREDATQKAIKVMNDEWAECGKDTTWGGAQQMAISGMIDDVASAIRGKAAKKEEG